MRSDTQLRPPSPYRLSIPRSDYRLRSADSERKTSTSANSRVVRQIETHAKKQGLDPALVEAVVRTESDYQADALSAKGAIGLMQVMPATGERFGVTNLENSDQNLRAGTRFLRHLINRYDNLPLALAAYNAGEGAVEKYGNVIPPYPETQAYVSTVLRHYQAQSLPGNAVSRTYLEGTRLDKTSWSLFRLNLDGKAGTTQ